MKNNFKKHKNLRKKNRNKMIFGIIEVKDREVKN